MKLYQNLPGFDHIDPKRKDSEYWNEGKWNNFIAPLLPRDSSDRTMIDMGCNAGLFLKMAKDYGFRDVIGVEKSRSTIKEGEKFRDKNGYDYEILNQTMGENFNVDQMPMADVTLLSNVHYYMKIYEFMKYLDKLRWKTIYCLVVTSDHKSPASHWRPSGMIPEVRNYFREWNEVEGVYRVKYTSRLVDDPAPRKLWSILFKSNLKRVPIKSLRWGAPGHKSGKRLYRDELAELIVECDLDFDFTKTQYYQSWIDRGWDERKALLFVSERVQQMYDIKINGMKEPIYINLDNKIVDGGHRVEILKALGYKSIIARVI